MTEDELDRLAEKIAKKLAPLMPGYFRPADTTVPVSITGTPYATIFSTPVSITATPYTTISTPVPITDVAPTSSMRPWMECASREGHFDELTSA